jgi:UDP-N-acetylglucosamine--N-acetylmuramyl-(pentapeptide) pyrophosphoryl-undecaprenol N-acetylglucosamine transferase
VRLLWHAIDGTGLGHVVRLLALARQVRRLRPGWQSVFLTNSDATAVITQEGFLAFKVPSRTSFDLAELSPGVQLRMVQATTLSIATAFNPHALITDTLAAGPHLELVPLLQWPIFKAFVYREQRAMARREPGFQEILRAYHVVLVPHAYRTVPLTAPPGPAVHWCGEVMIRTKGEALSRAAARRALGLPTAGQICLITAGGAGGGPTASQMLRAAISAASSIEGLTVVVARGPFGSEPLLDTSSRVISVFPLAMYLRAFDIAIATAGYNTVTELAHFRVPTVLVPVPRTLDDQHKRARMAAQHTGITYAREASPEKLAKSARRLLRRPRPPATTLRGNGATVAARVIVQSLERQLP